jgi:hypothetical protein
MGSNSAYHTKVSSFFFQCWGPEPYAHWAATLLLSYALSPQNVLSF